MTHGSRYPDQFYTKSTDPNFRLVTFGRRSYVDRRRNDITSGFIAIKDFLDNLIGSISFYFVHAHCLAWVTAVAVLCSSSNILTSSLTMSLFSFGLTLENTLLFVLPSPTRLVWGTSIMSFIRRLNSASWTTFVPDFISWYAFQMTSSAEPVIIMWRLTFLILNPSTSEDIGSCWYINLLSRNKEELPATHAGICCYTIESAQRNLIHL